MVLILVLTFDFWTKKDIQDINLECPQTLI